MADIETLTKFMKWVEELSPGEYVFRGVTDENHKIEATTYLRLKDKEGNFINPTDNSPEKLLKINEDMILNAKHQKHKRELTDLELLAELQHIGAATCLIDFTKNPFVALWMACRQQTSDKSEKGLVYAINVDDSQKYVRIKYKDLKKEIGEFFKRDDTEGYQCFMWQPDYQKPRMLAQQAVFLFGGAQVVETETYPVPNGNKNAIHKALKKSLDMDRGSLFPDVEGFASQWAHNRLYEGLENVSPEDRASSYLAQGLQAIKDRRIDDAISSYSTGLSFKPNPSLQSELYRERGHAHYSKENIEAAINDYGMAINIDSNNADSYFRRGYAKYKNNDNLDAISDFSIAINIDQTKGYYYYQRAMASYQLGFYVDAIPDLDKAIHLLPARPLYYYWRGMVSYNLHQYADAISYFDLAIEKDPSDSYFYYERGKANSRWGRYREAVFDFKNAIERRSDNPYFYYERGKALKRSRLFGPSKQDFQIALNYAESSQNNTLADAIRRELYSFS